MTASKHAIFAAIDAMDGNPENGSLARRVWTQIPEAQQDVFAQQLERVLPFLPDLRRALVGLLRYLEGNGAPEQAADCFTHLFAEQPDTLGLMLTVFSQSPYLTEILCRQPELLRWIADRATRKSAFSVADYAQHLAAAVSPEADFEEACRRMRLFQRRAMLRIGVRALADHAPLASVAEDLSNLADAMVETALQCARKPLLQRYGPPICDGTEDTESTFVVIALGKLGGRELNFSSDIDLVFLYAEDGHSQGPERIDNATWFRKLSELLIQALSENTDEGHIFRVDVRLRPHGRVAPLAVSWASAVEYYADFGRAWERQALIKARPCAGDLALGRDFTAQLRPFVFPRYFDDAMLQDIRETKQQTETLIARRGETEREVKLGRGGIRDIEFTVQMLQLLHGGHNPALRNTNTLAAINALGRTDNLSPLEATALADHYVFLRLVEHQLQLEEGRQCHALPANPAALDAFARAFGYEDGPAFMNVYRTHTAETRKILERFLAGKGAGNLWVTDLLQRHSDGAAGLEKLMELGFREPEKARIELQGLANGPHESPYPIHVRQRFAEIAPVLLASLGGTGNPDGLLLRLAELLRSIQAPSAVYDLLRYNETLAHYLVALVANSRYLTEILTRDPSLLDVVGAAEALARQPERAALQEALGALRRAYEPDAALYRLRDAEMLRTATRELMQGISVAQVGDALSLLAEVILEDALTQAEDWATARYGAAAAPMAVLGLGKLGGWEMGYGSDLDLVFVYDGKRPLENGMSPVEYFSAVASRAIRILKETTRHGRLYDIDLRLRPDGGKGMLAISLERLRTYFAEEAQPWERMALMKVRAVAGAPDFRETAESLAKDMAFGKAPDSEELTQLEAIRNKLVRQASPLDLKKADGGIGAIEFAVRYRQLQWVEAHPALRRGDVFGALDYMLAHELMDAAEGQTLRAAYDTLRRIMNRLRMMAGNDRSTLPESEAARQELASRLGIEGDLLAVVDTHRAQVREIYQHTLEAMRAAT